MSGEEYNGELRKLYNDIDKRLTVHEEGAKIREKYLHEKFHKLENGMANISMKIDINAEKTEKKLAKLDNLPCEERKVRDVVREKMLEERFKANESFTNSKIDSQGKQINWLWGVSVGTLIMIVKFAWEKMTGK